MHVAVEEAEPGERRYLSLKWKAFIALSLVLLTVNAGLAYLVFAKASRQHESRQSDRREAQVRELDVVLSKGLESVSNFASFIPLLSDCRIISSLTHSPFISKKVGPVIE